MNDQIANESTTLPAERPDDFRLFGTDDAVSKLFTEFAAAQGEFGPAVADSVGRVNEQRSFKYADLASIIAASRPALSKHGISLTQWPTGWDGAILTIVAGHGARIHSVLRFERPKLPKDQGAYWTYMCRYAMRAILGLPGDDDLDNTPNQARRDQPPAPQAKPPSKAQERPGPAKAQEQAPKGNGAVPPKSEPPPRRTDTTDEALDKAREAREAIHRDLNEQAAHSPRVSDPIDTTGTEVVDDVNGPDGEPVDDHPEFSDPHPMTDRTKTLVTQAMTKLLSVNGTGKDIPLTLRAAIVKHSSGVEMAKGVQFTEGEGQRIVAFLYEVANGIKLDPDGHLSQAEVKTAIKAFEKRVGIAS